LSGHYFTPREYVHRDNPSLLPIPADEPWQPDVYKLAGLVAHAVRATRIVDVGCGDAKKLQRLAAEHDVLGLDLLDVQVPEGVRFLPYDVLGPSPIPEAEGSLLIAADVIEHLGRPDVLLEKIRRSRCLGAVLSTPDRLSEYGYDHRGPPRNPRHVREWTAAEFERLLAHHGLDPVVLLTKTHVDGRRWATIVAICARW
jgi:SAM-dependent methyltransferase